MNYLDAKDRHILDLLQADAELPVAEIAERVGLSSTPCWRRIQRLVSRFNYLTLAAVAAAGPVFSSIIE